eukprot:scaffold140481_cov35-Prasinocladus_malaysianus.AAC.1
MPPDVPPRHSQVGQRQPVGPLACCTPVAVFFFYFSSSSNASDMLSLLLSSILKDQSAHGNVRGFGSIGKSARKIAYRCPCVSAIKASWPGTPPGRQPGYGSAAHQGSSAPSSTAALPMMVMMPDGQMQTVMVPVITGG